MQPLLGDENPFVKYLAVTTVIPNVLEMFSWHVWMEFCCALFCRLHVTSTLTGWVRWKSWMTTTSWGQRMLSISSYARRTGRRNMWLIQSPPVFIHDVNMLCPCIYGVITSNPFSKLLAVQLSSLLNSWPIIPVFKMYSRRLAQKMIVLH